MLIIEIFLSMKIANLFKGFIFNFTFKDLDRPKHLSKFLKLVKFNDKSCSVTCTNIPKKFKKKVKMQMLKVRKIVIKGYSSGA